MSANSPVNFGRPAPNDVGRQEVMAAAADVFMAHGFDGASMDDIADRMGATKGRVYHYYRRKIDILFDIHAHYLELNLAEARPIADRGAPASERLFEMSRSHVLRIMNHIAFARVGLFSTMQTSTGANADELREVISKSRTQYEELFLRVLEDGMGAGEFRTVDPHVVSKALLGALNWTAVWYSPLSGRRIKKEALADQIAEFSVAGVRAP